jgi:hypothetical protein
VKNQIEVAEQVENGGRHGHGDILGGLVALTIEVLIPTIKRRREKASFSPFKGPFRAALVPHRCRAAPFENIDLLFIEMALRFELSAGGSIRLKSASRWRKPRRNS